MFYICFSLSSIHIHVILFHSIENIPWPHFPGVSFGFGELIPIGIKKKCMNCLEIYWGLHVLMFAYSHLLSHLVYVLYIIVFYSYSYNSFLFDTEYSWPHFPGVSFRFSELIPIRIKKKCMNCLEIYYRLHVLMFAYSHFPVLYMLFCFSSVLLCH